MDADPYHDGERRAQAMAGAEEYPSGAAIRDFMPDQHRIFFAQLPWVAAATVDAEGAPVATVLAGGPGFVASPDPRSLAIAARPLGPAAAHFNAGAPLGLLGIELHTRRRNRANGRIAFAGEEGLIVEVLQSFGNCPQYIHPREVAYAPTGEPVFETFDGLFAEAREQIAAADTFFVATASGPGVRAGGVDVSHRGGAAGFVQLVGDTLVIPDYRGNRYFNTLGNLLLEPRAALLFVDFETGRMLQLQGRAEVAWHDHDLPHAERTWRFTVERGWRGPAGVRSQAAVQPPSSVNAAPVADPPRSDTR